MPFCVRCGASQIADDGGRFHCPTVTEWSGIITRPQSAECALREAAPLPWRGHEVFIEDADGVVCAYVTRPMETAAPIRDLIVKAVNVHGDLIVSLAQARSFFHWEQRLNFPGQHQPEPWDCAEEPCGRWNAVLRLAWGEAQLPDEAQRTAGARP